VSASRTANWREPPPNSFETPSPTFYSTIRPESIISARWLARKKLKFDPELLSHRGHVSRHRPDQGNSSATERFEVDSANAARAFLRQHGIDEPAIDVVWDAIDCTPRRAFRSTRSGSSPGETGVEMDVLGLGYLDVPDPHREA